MDFKLKIYPAIPLLIFLLFSCTSPPSNAGYARKVAKKVPQIYKAADDPGFSFHQDTLYYNNIRFSGVQVSIFHNGDTAAVKPYFEGLEEGWHKRWYPNKRMAEQRFYVSGKKEGLHRAWWPNGNKKFSYEFNNDEFDGENKDWYESGPIFKIFHYSKGHEEGSIQMFWINGQVRANYIIKNQRRYGLLGTKNCINVADSVFVKR